MAETTQKSYRSLVVCLVILVAWFCVIKGGVWQFRSEAWTFGDAGAYAAVAARFATDGTFFNRTRQPVYPALLWILSDGATSTEEVKSRASNWIPYLQSLGTLIVSVGAFFGIAALVRDPFVALVSVSLMLLHRELHLYDYTMHTESLTNFALGGWFTFLILYSVTARTWMLYALTLLGFLLANIRPNGWPFVLISLAVLAVFRNALLATDTGYRTCSFCLAGLLHVSEQDREWRPDT